MSIVSIGFIFFILLTIIIYFGVPSKYQWMVLLLFSYVFYAINSRWLLLVHLATNVVTYCISRVVDRCNKRNKTLLENKKNLTKDEQKDIRLKAKKEAGSIAAIGILVNISALLFLKYYNFFISIPNCLLEKVGHGLIPTLNMLLPLGISFYTLQAIGYLVDVRKGKVEPDKNIFKFLLFMAYFPQIIQGPIARYNKLAKQLTDGHRFDFEKLKFGAQLILWGFFKKLVIADRIAIPVNTLFNNSDRYEGPILFLAAAMYGVQVYADFSAGMDVARGFSEILGIELDLNFEQPYFSKSIEEFWRRWHITLGAWMRDYIFYPLSLSKRFGRIGNACRNIVGQKAGNRIPAFLSMFIVYFLVGFWHGANWTYIMYGVWNGVFISTGILLADRYDIWRKSFGINVQSFSWKLFQMTRTFVICSLGRFFSRATSMEQAFKMLTSSISKFYKIQFVTDGTLLGLGLDTADWGLLVIVLVILFAVDYMHEKGWKIREGISRRNIVLRWTIYYLGIFGIVIFGIYGSGYDATSFIYAQF